MLTKASSELTLFDRLSRLSFNSAAKLLGAEGNRLITAGGKYDIDIFTQVQLDRDRFQLTLACLVVTYDSSKSRASPRRFALGRYSNAALARAL